LTTNSVELFAHIETPWNVFLNGFIGTGATTSGGQNDEDFHIVNPAPARPYNNTFSTNVGHSTYGVLDLGYDVLRRGDYKVGPFVGYTYFDQYIFKSGCLQIANPAGNCSPTGMSAPLSTSQLIGLENMAWQAVRVGLSGEARLTDRLKLNADVAYLPYVFYSWLDDHLGRDLQVSMFGHGEGMQAQAVLSYDATERLSVGIGGRYWSMWSTSALHQFIPGQAGPNRNAVEMAGAFAQVDYHFAPGGATAASAPLLSYAPIFKAPAFKAPAAAPAYDWTGFYTGIEGGWTWGETKQVGQPTNRITFDSTPSFHTSGGLIGATVGYNSQFNRMWVFGFEGDMSWTDASGSAPALPPFNARETADTREHWLSTMRSRLGVTPADHWLVYVTGGLAVADVEAVVTVPTSSESDSHVRWGWTAGGGIEAAVARNWSAKLEYLYVGLENVAYFVPTPNNPFASNRAGGVPLSHQILRAGVNYRFDWPSL
jgi:opacity protein-like surface antigen